MLIRGGVRRYREEHLPRLPLTADIVKKLIPFIPTSNINLRAEFCLGFAGRLQFRKFTSNDSNPDTYSRPQVKPTHIGSNTDTRSVTITFTLYITWKKKTHISSGTHSPHHLILFIPHSQSLLHSHAASAGPESALHLKIQSLHR